ncbi:hypothetical protein [Burkholderia gladioli]|uniref:hypothetical protein n=1 Tax=Burkholderia gladioli TaxID=28095 RepID=UPI00163E4779|nr:hypothetical protein [Burkholderia gladioli]
MALLDILLPPAVLGSIMTYALGHFDGLRKERRSAKSLVFICWYGARPLPVRLPRWMALAASIFRKHLHRAADPIAQPATRRRRVVAFIANNGRTALIAEDLFHSTPLKLKLSGDGQLVDVRIRYASEQTADLKVSGARTFFRRSKSDLTERTIRFGYMAPGHGLALDIDYEVHGPEPVSFNLSGPVKGIKGSIPQQVLFEIEIEDTQRRRRQRRSENGRLWLGSLMMAGAMIIGSVEAATNGHFSASKFWPYWFTLGILLAGEIIALGAWFRVKQVRKIPSALRFWEPSHKYVPRTLTDPRDGATGSM